MSEGRSPNDTLEELKQPTPNDINLLHQIILRAQNDPLSRTSPKEALFAAHEAVFEEHGLDVLQDTQCLWLLLKISAPGGPPGNLYTKFERVLRDEGIELSFDDDASTKDSAPSPTRGAESVGSEVKPSLSKRAVENLATTSVVPDVHPDHDDYMDNPPPHIVQLMHTAEVMDRKTLLRQSLSTLRTRNVALLAHQADIHYVGRLLSKVLSHWRNVADERQTDLVKADQKYELNLRKASLTKICDAARIQRMQAMNEERLKGLGLYKMTLATREAHFVRKMDIKIKRIALGKLVQTLRAGQIQCLNLEGVLQQQQACSNARLLRPTLQILLKKTRQAHVMNVTADGHHAASAAQDSINRWYGKAHDIQEQRLRADDLREYFLMRKYLRKFKLAAQAKRDRRYILVKWTFGRWRTFVDNSKHKKYDENYKIVRRMIKMNLARKQLKKILDETARVKNVEWHADQHRNQNLRRLAHDAVIRMYHKAMQMKEFERVADVRADVFALKRSMEALSNKAGQVRQIGDIAERYQRLHTQRVAGRMVRQMGMRSFEIQRRTQDASAFRGRQDKKSIRLLLDKMRVAAADSRGEGPLKLPPATPAQRRAEELHRLSSTTPRYTPARSNAFSARLRGDGPMTNRTAERIVEEMEEEDEHS